MSSANPANIISMGLILGLIGYMLGGTIAGIIVFTVVTGAAITKNKKDN